MVLGSTTEAYVATFCSDRKRAVNNVTSFPAGPDVNIRNASLGPASRIFLLGKTQVIDAIGENVLPKAKKTQAVFAYLCLSQGARVPRSRIADLVWDRSGEAQGLDALRHALSDLNRIDATWRLQRERDAVRFDISGCWVDAFETPDQPDCLLENLHGISAGFDQWLHAERTRYENRWRTDLEKKLQDLIAQDASPAQRAAAARELLNVLPTHEVAVQSLMKAFVDMDERAEAIREFERHRLLTQANGLPIAQRTVALYEAIRIAPTVRLARLSSNWPQQEARSGDAQARLNPNPGPDRTTASGAARIFEPSIAVLPFRNLSGAKARDYIVDGLTEDLVEALSRIPGLFVVSRLSSAIFKKQDRPPQEIGAALGVRYLLSGSLRIIDGHVRLVVELGEAETGRGLWRDRFNEKTSDLLQLQSVLAEAVVGAVAPQLRAAELKRVRIARPEDYTAYHFFLRAQESMHATSWAVFENAEHLFNEAIGREPYYATALAWRAYWHVMRVGQGWSLDRAADAQQAEFFAERAIECDPMEAMAFAVQGHTAAYLRKDFDQAFASFEKALQINSNSARAWLWNASAHGWTSEGGPAVEKINQAMALSPYDPLISAYSGSASLAYLADHQYERSIEFALRSIRENRSYSGAYKLLIPALVMAGREKEAQAPLQQLLRLEPEFTVEQFRRRFPGGGWEIGAVCAEGLAKAGVPCSD
jgi:TolB-like protein/DNA-binding SARP family transcriptional activator